MITKFDVAVESSEGEPVCTIREIPAQTKKEAINKAIQRLTFTAERCTVKAK